MSTTQKPDTRTNATTLDDLIERQHKRERRLHPLRINRQTVIYVTRDKCNEAYAGGRP